MPANKSGQSKAKIEEGQERDHKLEEIIAAKALEWAMDPEVMDLLPASAKASIIQNRLPKPQVVDKDFEASILSISSLLSGLPASQDSYVLIPQLRAAIRKARGELKMANLKLKTSKFSAPKVASFVDLLERAWREGVEYGRQSEVHAAVAQVPLKEFEARVEELMDE